MMNLSFSGAVAAFGTGMMGAVVATGALCARGEAQDAPLAPPPPESHSGHAAAPPPAAPQPDTRAGQTDAAPVNDSDAAPRHSAAPEKSTISDPVFQDQSTPPPARPRAASSTPAEPPAPKRAKGGSDAKRVVAPYAPPADPAPQKVPARPSVNHRWIPGYWYWDGLGFVWVSGRWLAPRPGYVYIGPRWLRHRRGWLFVPGGWAIAGTWEVVHPLYWHLYPGPHYGPYYRFRHDGRHRRRWLYRPPPRTSRRARVRTERKASAKRR